tara:strand:+ start:451 stop:987 length:537 start_codon:yes stop_codon:yes gene_type:complete
MDHIVEFSRPVTADKIGVDSMSLECKAKEDELTSLVARFDLVSLESLMFSLKFKRSETTGIIEAAGRLTAAGFQKCVITLEPVEFELDQTISWSFLDKSNDGQEADFDTEIPKSAELIDNNQIDFGELAAQQLAILLDPYPRAPGAKIPADGLWFGEIDRNIDNNNAFSVLSRLKYKK